MSAERLPGKPAGMPRFLLFCVVSLSVTLALALSATFAWLGKQTTTEAEGEMQFDNRMVASTDFEVYRYDPDTGLGTLTAAGDTSLPLYDTVFTEQNAYSMLELRVPVFGPCIAEGRDFTISVSLKDMSGETGIADGNYLDGSKTPALPETAVADYTSNVIYVKCAVLPESAYPGLQAVDIQPPGGQNAADYAYRSMQAYFADSKNTYDEQSFVTGNKGERSKRDQLDFTVSGYAATDLLYVCIEIGYRDDLVAEMIESRDLSLSFGDNTVEIACDLSEFIFDMPEDR